MATRPAIVRAQEQLLMATHSIRFAVEELQEANRLADPLMSILLLQAIQRANELHSFVAHIQSAHKEEGQ